MKSSILANQKLWGQLLTSSVELSCRLRDGKRITVSLFVLIDGKPRSIYGVLEDPEVLNVLSDEGAIQVRRLLSFPDASPPFR